MHGARRVFVLAFLAAATPATAATAFQDGGFERLFASGDLAGWRVVGGDAVFELEDGVLRGHGDSRHNTFLVSEAMWADFVLELELRVSPEGNSGVQFRSHVREDGRLFGYQAEVDPSARAWSGGIYDEGRRGWLDPLEGDEAARAAFDPDGWNHYRIEARGPLLRTWVNGVPCGDLVDEMDASGRLAFQVHGGGSTEARFRNVRIRALPPLSERAGGARAAILEDVEVVPRRGVPGTISVFGPHAAVVLTSGRERPRALAAIAEYGLGRAFAVAHDGYLSAARWTPEAGPALAPAALAWITGGEAPARIALLGDDRGLAAALRARGHRVSASADPAALEGFDVVVLRGEPPMDEAQARALRAFVARGGGLMAATCPWGWQQVHRGRGWRLREDLGDNQVLAPMGLCFAGGYADDGAGGGFAVEASRADAAHAVRALQELAAGRAPAAVGVVEHAIHAVPAAEDYLQRVRAVAGPMDAERAPRPGRPLAAGEDVRARIAVVLAQRAWEEAPPQEISAAPGADAFPGAVPEDAARVAATITLDPGGRRWQCRGLYVPPGAPVSLRVTKGAARGWSVLVGAHRDTLWHKARWERWPEVSWKRPLREEMTVATPFGGLLYLVRGEGAGAATVRVEGAVEAPWYSLTEGHSPAEWRRRRAAPGPWAELAGEHLVLTVPARAVRDLRDPEPLLRFWDSVVEAHCDLGAEPLPDHEERFVADVQISAGYMHAGFPIMMHLDVAEPREDGPAVLLDLDALEEEGNWGCFHELGHNRQRPEWTFGGTGEVTCNLFSLHAGDVLCGIEPWENPWLRKQKAAGRRYLEEGADYAQWRRRPGVALLVYAQVQREFGWEPFRETFAGYRETSPGERPRSDGEKRDEWVRRLSLATGRDLRPLHRRWGWPLGAALAADEELDRLPQWMPDFGEL